MPLDIQVETHGTVARERQPNQRAGDVHFRLNGHLFLFDGSEGEKYTLRRDLEHAREILKRNNERKP
jgi:hypothetical protein